MGFSVIDVGSTLVDTGWVGRSVPWMSFERTAGSSKTSRFPLTSEELTQLTDRLLDENDEAPLSFAAHYQEFAKASGRLKSLLEMPQHYPSQEILYQKDVKFLPVSTNNIASYVVIGNDGDFEYVVHPHRTSGYAINLGELKHALKTKNDVLPAMVVSLRDTPLGMKQAHALRIRERYGRNHVATDWYVGYVQRFNAIASDFEHLEGGMLLWRSLIDNAKQRGLEVCTHSFDANETKPVDASTPLEEIWSTTPEKRNMVIILKKHLQ